MRTISAAMGTLAVIALTGCGGSSSSSSSQASASPARTAPPARTAATGSGTATATPTATSRTTAGSGTPCTAARLSLSFLGQQGATGHGEVGFLLRNVSSGGCRTFGYPGVVFLGRSGQALPTDSTRTTHDLAGSVTEQSIDLAPGASASFRLIVTHGIASSAGCTTAYGLQVIPPDDTSTLRVSIPGGAYECTTATLSPLQPGSSAYR